VAVAQGWSFSPELFRTWSLEVFLGLLAYDWLRVLIWFDHMGLRVATLVNLSFVGGDRLDERLGRWLGHSARARGIPEGIRRFATWAPLLIPFYIPRGAEWDQVWTGAERVATSGSPILPGVTTVLLGYGVATGCALAIAAVVWTHHQRRPAVRRPAGALVASNGVYALELARDGRGFSRALSWARPDFEIDLTRRPDDPLQLRGKLFYLREAGGPAWSLGQQPLQVTGPDYEVSQPTPTSLRIVNTVAGIRAVATAEIGDAKSVETWRLVLRNLEQRPRLIELTSYQELALAGSGGYQRAPAYNGMHVGTWFVAKLGAVLAQNRLLRDAENHLSRQRMSHEVAFHAVRTGDAVRLVGYEDSRPCFVGDGTLRTPAALEAALRDPADEGLLYSFDPIAALRVSVELPASGQVEILFVDGLAPSSEAAARLIAAATGQAPPAPAELAAVLGRTRELLEPAKPIAPEPGFAFSDDGTELHTTPHTARPWAHLLASPLGHGAILGNDGEMFSFAGNAQQNGLTPFGLVSLPSQLPSQLVYAVDLDSGEIDTATFVPYRRADARYGVVFGRGYAQFSMARGSLELELTACVLAEQPAELRLLRIRNRSGKAKRLRIVAYAQIALAELAQDTRWTGIDAQAEPGASTVLFASHGNDFRRGWGFMASSLPCEAHETVRSRFIGGDGRDLANPCFVAYGGADSGRPDDGLRCAALAGSLEVPAGGEALVSVVIGQAPLRSEALRLAETYRDPQAAERAVAVTRDWWRGKLSGLRVETNLPAFDRLVNDWLPYQALTARLWGRAGPSQRSGAFGFRDQLQDVLPFLPTWPELARKQILLHAGQQFVGGDVLKWWHVSWQGATGRGERTHASDPHLWLPYVVARYIRATGDAAILDERTAFLEGESIPPGRDGLLVAPRPSRESATVYEHCRRAIELALTRRGRNGIPLMGAGDWNDGFDLVGREGRGESVWVGFFLHAILGDFIPLAERRDAASAARWKEQAGLLREALARMWRGNRFLRATTDDGGELAIWDALMPAWAALSGAVEPERSLQALDAALSRLERPNLVQLVEPAFDEDSRPYPGRIADYPPGVRENGGQYSHGASWLVDAFALLATQADAAGDAAQAARLRDRAIELWGKISPVDRYGPGETHRYGLPPHQQPADVYFGKGYEGRGGWSWYTGSAGRMLDAAHAILGLRMQDGELVVPPDLLAPKGALQVQRLLYRGRDVTPAPCRSTA
jgi:cyclic beta-1,2-glucan synthetase